MEETYNLRPCGLSGRLIAEVREFVGTFEISGVDGADGEKYKVLERVTEEARDVERGVEAEAVVAVDEEDCGAVFRIESGDAGGIL